MNAFYYILPLLVLPFINAWIFKKTGAKRKLSYLIMAVFVPSYPLFLVHFGILPENGVVLAGTSVLMIPAVLFVQYLANKWLYNKQDTIQ